MFGYVRPAMALFSPEEKARYQGAYCGLCHAMGRRHGFAARFTLSYDFAFLAILFSGQSEDHWCQRRCPIHPLKKKRCCMCGAGMDAAADASMILTWHKLRDDVADNGFWRGLPARLLSLLLLRPYRKARASRPEFAHCVECELARLNGMEKEGLASIDRTADAFACILKGAAPSDAGEGKRRVMEQMLYHIGRWIYLVDAWDDLREDRVQGRYNPLLARFGAAAEGEKEYISTTMSHSLKLAVSAANLIGFGQWDSIMQNVLYKGLPSVQQAVLTGQWKEKKKQHREIDQ